MAGRVVAIDKVLGDNSVDILLYPYPCIVIRVLRGVPVGAVGGELYLAEAVAEVVCVYCFFDEISVRLRFIFFGFDLLDT